MKKNEFFHLNAIDEEQGKKIDTTDQDQVDKGDLQKRIKEQSNHYKSDQTEESSAQGQLLKKR